MNPPPYLGYWLPLANYKNQPLSSAFSGNFPETIGPQNYPPFPRKWEHAHGPLMHSSVCVWGGPPHGGGGLTPWLFTYTLIWFDFDLTLFPQPYQIKLYYQKLFVQISLSVGLKKKKNEQLCYIAISSEPKSKISTFCFPYRMLWYD